MFLTSVLCFLKEANRDQQQHETSTTVSLQSRSLCKG